MVKKMGHGCAVAVSSGLEPAHPPVRTWGLRPQTPSLELDLGHFVNPRWGRGRGVVRGGTIRGGGPHYVAAKARQAIERLSSSLASRSVRVSIGWLSPISLSKRSPRLSTDCSAR